MLVSRIYCKKISFFNPRSKCQHSITAIYRFEYFETPGQPDAPAVITPAAPQLMVNIPDAVTPEAAPLVPVTPTPIPTPTTPEKEVIIDSALPQGGQEAALPKTGGIPAGMLYLLGSGLAGLGIVIKRRNK